MPLICRDAVWQRHSNVMLSASATGHVATAGNPAVSGCSPLSSRALCFN